jgi:hypothetical protein
LGVFARRFDENGQGLAPEILVNTETQGYQFGTDVFADMDGSFLVIWTDDFTKFVARRLDSAGVPSGSPFDLPITTSSPAGIDVLLNSGGGMTVAWGDVDHEFNSGTDVFVQRFRVRRRRQRHRR